ncbi:MAG TPA: heme-binding protein [Methylocystis sp.]|nr:heme-binding protein [Methylocystis sp.]
MLKLTTTAAILLASAGLALAQSAPQQPAQAAAPQQAPPPPPARGPSFDLALEAAQTALEAGKAADQKVAVTVIDSAGVLKAVLVSDGTGPRAVQNSNFKAQAALAFKEPSGQLAEQVKTDKNLAEKVAANPNYLPRAGAVLIKVNDEIIGAIGVGGARGSDKDEQYALAGLQKVQARLK